MTIINKVWAVYFSPTGTTRKIAFATGRGLSRALKSDFEEYDFTLPKARVQALHFSPTDLVVLGTPVYAGRVPNVLLPYLNSIEGNEALAIPIVLFGNRNYDDALIELRDILEKDGFHTLAAGAFVGEHSFSRILAKNRPDAQDMDIVSEFVQQIVAKLHGSTDSPKHPIPVSGMPFPYRAYSSPRDRQGNPVDIRKVKPLTNDRCNDCKLCAKVCPMGSISFDNVREFTGICIKCGACIKKCPKQAKYYEDAGYLYHQHELEEELTRRAENMLFV